MTLRSWLWGGICLARSFDGAHSRSMTGCFGSLLAGSVALLGVCWPILEPSGQVMYRSFSANVETVTLALQNSRVPTLPRAVTGGSPISLACTSDLPGTRGLPPGVGQTLFALKPCNNRTLHKEHHLHIGFPSTRVYTLSGQQLYGVNGAPFAHWVSQHSWLATCILEPFAFTCYMHDRSFPHLEGCNEVVHEWLDFSDTEDFRPQEMGHQALHMKSVELSEDSIALKSSLWVKSHRGFHCLVNPVEEYNIIALMWERVEHSSC